MRTTPSSRIFLKNLFKEIASTMGTKSMTLRFKKARKAGDMVGVLPTDKRENSRFAIDFFTSIDLAYLVEDLRESMKNASAAANNANDEVSSSSALSSSSSESSVLSESSGEEDEIAGTGSSRGRFTRGGRGAQRQQSYQFGLGTYQRCGKPRNEQRRGVD